MLRQFWRRTNIFWLHCLLLARELITDPDGWQRALRTVTGSWNCVLVPPNLSGYKQSHLAAAPVTLFPHQPLLSLSCNLCQLSGGRSMRVKTWQALPMSPLSSDQRAFIRSEWCMGLIYAEAKDGDTRLPTAPFVWVTWILMASCTLFSLINTAGNWIKSCRHLKQNLVKYWESLSNPMCLSLCY